MTVPTPGAPRPHGTCRICASALTTFLDLGSQPLSDAFRAPADTSAEFFYNLAVGRCSSCTMVQLVQEVDRARMFHADYPYYSSGSQAMRRHFEQVARSFLATELTGADPFAVEIGCNDGAMLRTIGAAGVRHLGVEPATRVADEARRNGVRVRSDFFQRDTAAEIRDEHGPADVIYAANTFCHIPYVASVFRGVDTLLSSQGVFVFEDPYLGDIIEKTAFDQIYDEHFYLFSVESVARMAEHFGFTLVDVQRLPVHGGEVRYTLVRSGARTVSNAVRELRAKEERRQLHQMATLNAFARRVDQTRADLRGLLHDLSRTGATVAAYGATAKSATVANFCGIGPDLVSYVCDTTPTKQGQLTPGMHIPVRSEKHFSESYPDYALLFAWNHAEEIMNKENDFHDRGGRWINYVPTVYVN